MEETSFVVNYPTNNNKNHNENKEKIVAVNICNESRKRGAVTY